MKNPYAQPSHDVDAALKSAGISTNKKPRYPIIRAALAFLAVLVSMGAYLLETKNAEIEAIAISALIPAILIVAVINISSYGIGYLSSLVFKADRIPTTYKLLNLFHYILYIAFWFAHGNPLGR